MNPSAQKFIYCDNESEITVHAAALIIAGAYHAVARHNRCSVVLAGGNSPRPLYTQLAEGVSSAILDHYGLSVPEGLTKKREELYKLPHNTCFFMSDERYVPLNHPDSNYRMITETLLPSSGISEKHFFRMATEPADTEEAAREYETVMRDFFITAKPPETFPVFDFIVLGLGEDGHTASLFADTIEALLEKKRWVLAVYVPQAKPPGMRLTLTLPVINHARNVLFFTPGTTKSKLSEKIFLEQEKNVPASLVKPENGRVFWFTSRSSPPIPALVNEPHRSQAVDLRHPT